MADQDIDEENWFYEGYGDAIEDGIKEAGGTRAPDPGHPSEPVGVAWSEDDVYDRYPRLEAEFGSL